MAVKKRKSKRARPRKPSQQRPKKAVKAATRTKKKKALRGKRRRPRVKGKADSGTLVGYGTRGLGARSGGQSGDTQGLAASPDVDSESVEELIEEGQAFEAEVLDGIENVPDPDEGEVRTKEVPEEDVPEEYQKPDRD